MKAWEGKCNQSAEQWLSRLTRAFPKGELEGWGSLTLSGCVVGNVSFRGERL